MAFREAVTGKAFKLAETAFGEVFIITVLDAARDKALFKVRHAADASKCAQRPAKTIRLCPAPSVWAAFSYSFRDGRTHSEGLMRTDMIVLA